MFTEVGKPYKTLKPLLPMQLYCLEYILGIHLYNCVPHPQSGALEVTNASSSHSIFPTNAAGIAMCHLVCFNFQLSPLYGDPEIHLASTVEILPSFIFTIK